MQTIIGPVAPGKAYHPCLNSGILSSCWTAGLTLGSRLPKRCKLERDIAPPTILNYFRSKFYDEFNLVRNHHRFKLAWANVDNGGEKLRHSCETILAHLQFQSQLYKIGVTHVPHSRFFKRYEVSPGTHQSYSQQFNYMVLVAVHTQPDAIGLMEASAMREMKDIRKIPGSRVHFMQGFASAS